MSGPTLAHEIRVRHLETLAVLSGCRAAACLGPGTHPDVVRVDHPTRRLFVGDAKATETAGCAETVRRLRRYAAAAVPWVRAGYVVRLVVCHGRATGSWRRQLEALGTRVRVDVVGDGTRDLDDATAVSWVDVVGRRPTMQNWLDAVDADVFLMGDRHRN